MATLDVSRVLLNSKFSTYLTIKRREQIVDDYGRIGDPNITTFKIRGVLLPSRINDNKVDLRRVEQFEFMQRSMNVYTQFKLRGSSKVGNPDGSVRYFLPDVLVWHNTDFILVTFDIYTQFGKGFYRGMFQSETFNDEAP